MFFYMFVLFANLPTVALKAVGWAVIRVFEFQRWIKKEYFQRVVICLATLFPTKRKFLKELSHFCLNFAEQRSQIIAINYL